MFIVSGKLVRGALGRRSSLKKDVVHPVYCSRDQIRKSDLELGHTDVTGSLKRSTFRVLVGSLI